MSNTIPRIDVNSNSPSESQGHSSSNVGDSVPTVARRIPSTLPLSDLEFISGGMADIQALFAVHQLSDISQDVTLDNAAHLRGMYDISSVTSYTSYYPQDTMLSSIEYVDGALLECVDDALLSFHPGPDSFPVGYQIHSTPLQPHVCPTCSHRRFLQTEPILY